MSTHAPVSTSMTRWPITILSSSSSPGPMKVFSPTTVRESRAPSLTNEPLPTITSPSRRTFRANQVLSFSSTGALTSEPCSMITFRPR